MDAADPYWCYTHTNTLNVQCIEIYSNDDLITSFYIGALPTLHVITISTMHGVHNNIVFYGGSDFIIQF